jgi:trehalose synthase
MGRAVAKRIEIERIRSLDDYEQYAHIAPSVRTLREAAEPVARALAGRTLWMVNSTVQGGGVSEMLPGMVSHLRELGFAVEWVVIEAEDDYFFPLTKRIHNLIHGNGEAGLTEEDRSVFEATSRANATELRELLRDGDILAVHDPQPMPLAGMLRGHLDLTTIWRCHIGLDATTRETRDAWRFLEPYADAYDHAIFSAPDYVAPYLEGRSSIIYPAIDPLTPKNRPLGVQAVVAVLERSGLLQEPGPRVLPQYRHLAQRLQPDGTFRSALEPDDLGLLTRPVVTQVSRWDRLKGFVPLLHGFARFKRDLRTRPPENETRRLELARLVLAGPDPGSIDDDPEGQQVLDEIRREYVALAEDVRNDIAVIALPMENLQRNALMVNALQRVSTIVVQNSIREGFGLTIAEAMWKSVPVLSNSHACGPRQQLRDGVEGRMIRNPESAGEIAGALRSMLSHRKRLDRWGLAGQRQVSDHFLVHSQLCHWVRLLAQLTGVRRS